jgi:HD-GYP domain-containing protein (c-di-GMP phosphodiesterase class II)
LYFTFIKGFLMLKRIAVSQVDLGMFIHKLEARWFDHPFWKSRFLLEDPENLRDLKKSGIASVVIDTSKGKDIAPQPAVRKATIAGAPIQKRPAVVASRPTSRIAALKSRQSIDLKSTRAAPIGQELKPAQQVMANAQRGLEKVLVDARLGKAVKLKAVVPIVQEIYASVQRNPHAFSGLMRCKLNNEFVYRHSLAVSALMISLARKMRLNAADTREAGLAGLFLDIGTNYLPVEIMPQNGDFRNTEPALWQQHVMLGHNALVSAGGIPQSVLDACLQHHERIDGAGFPAHLSGNAISTIGKMAAICDTFDYLLLDCDASSALDPASAIRAMQDMAGAFDPDILQHFIESVGIYPVGSFVRLRSERIAMVIDEDPEDHEHPVVKPFYSLTQDCRIQGKVIHLAQCQGEDEIIGIADLSGLVLPEEKQLRDLLFLTAHKAS